LKQFIKTKPKIIELHTYHKIKVVHYLVLTNYKT